MGDADRRRYCRFTGTPAQAGKPPGARGTRGRAGPPSPTPNDRPRARGPPLRPRPRSSSGGLAGGGMDGWQRLTSCSSSNEDKSEKGGFGEGMKPRPDGFYKIQPRRSCIEKCLDERRRPSSPTRQLSKRIVADWWCSCCCSPSLTALDFVASHPCIRSSGINFVAGCPFVRSADNHKLLANILDNHCIECSKMIEAGNSEGEFDGHPFSSYDFLYLPLDFKNSSFLDSQEQQKQVSSLRRSSSMCRCSQDDTGV